MFSTLPQRALVLGLLMAIGPFSVDMYLPAFPTIAADLGTTTGATQATFITYLLAIATFQLVYGPLSDQLGRRRPVFVGLSVCIAGCLVCLFAPTIEVLLLGRFLQGIGAGVGIVTSRAIIRDLYTGVRATRLMSLVMLVYSVSPLLAPLAGSLIMEGIGWRGIFGFVAGIVVVALLLVIFVVPETLPPERRVASNVRTLVANYRRVFSDGRFLQLAMIGGCCSASLFAFLTSSPFVYMEAYGLTPVQFSFAFAAFGSAYFIGAQFAPPFSARYGFGPIILTAASAYCGLMLILLLLVLVGLGTLPALMILLFLGSGCVGLIMPTTAVMGMDRHGPVAGSASAVMGLLQYATGVVVLSLNGIVFNGTAVAMVAMIAACALGAALFAQLAVGPKTWIVDRD